MDLLIRYWNKAERIAEDGYGRLMFFAHLFQIYLIIFKGAGLSSYIHIWMDSPNLIFKFVSGKNLREQ